MEGLSYDFSAVFIRDLKRYYSENWLLVEVFITGSLKNVIIRNFTAGISKGITEKLFMCGYWQMFISVQSL